MKPNPLMVILFVLAASFMGRFINFAGAAAENISDAELSAEASEAAMSKETENIAPPAEPEPVISMLSAPLQADTAHHDSGLSEPSDVLEETDSVDRSALLKAVRVRSTTLAKHEADLADRVRLLEVVERRVDEKILVLKSVKEELESRLVFADSAAKEDVTLLARMYEQMKPQKAGEIFNAMDSSFAAGFLTEMNSDSAAQILTNMETNKAYAVSVMIAGRNANLDRP